MDNNNFCFNSQCHSQVKSSLGTAQAAVRAQVEFECFDASTAEVADFICNIIAEVYILPPTAKVRIRGNDLPAKVVQAAYLKLTHEHINLVAENFMSVTYEIKRITTYLRTALYNAVFELAARNANDFNRFSAEITKGACFG